MTRKYLVLFAAVSMAAGTLTVRAQQATDTTGAQAQQQPAAGAAAAAGHQQSPYADDIKRVLARVTEDGVKGKPKDIADNFTANAQDQFKKSGKAAAETGPGAQAQNEDQRKQEMKALDDQLRDSSKQFADAWKAKYNHDFNIDRKAEAMVYSGDTFQILQGDVSNAAQPRTAGEREGAAAQPGAKATAEEEKRMATVKVQEGHGLPALSLLLVNEGTFGNKWHIQPQPGLDYKTLSTNLNKQLQDLVAMKDQWPQDENEAYKIVSHHILTAVASPSGAQAASSGQPGAAQPAGYRAGEQPQQQQQPQQPSR